MDVHSLSNIIRSKTFYEACEAVAIFHIVDTVHLRHIKLSYRPTDAH
jgi:hypothetical protein